MALTSGMRVGELLALRWQDVDLARKTVTVRHTLMPTRALKEANPSPDTGIEARLAPTKTTAGFRSLPIGEAVAAILEDHRIR